MELLDIFVLCLWACNNIPEQRSEWILKNARVFFLLIAYDKQLLDEVFVIGRIINVEVRVISRAEGEADNSYRDIW